MQGLVALADAGGVLVGSLLLVDVEVEVEVDGVSGDWHADTIKAKIIVILNNQYFFIFTSFVRRSPVISSIWD